MPVVNIRTVKGKRPKYDIYIGRELNYPNATFPKSKWANPFSVERYGRNIALTLYEQHIRNTPELFNALPELKGKILGCWCKPKSCHGDILLILLKEMEEPCEHGWVYTEDETFCHYCEGCCF